MRVLRLVGAHADQWLKKVRGQLKDSLEQQRGREGRGGKKEKERSRRESEERKGGSKKREKEEEKNREG